MAKNKRPNTTKEKPVSKGMAHFIWKIASIAAIIISVSLIVKLVLLDSRPESARVESDAPSPQLAGAFDARVQLVASRFKCACGGCGELPLAECECDMPQGAVEEKTFIRNQLEKGLTIDQVVKLVDEKYGLKVS